MLMLLLLLSCVVAALIHVCVFCGVRFSSPRTLQAHIANYCSRKPLAAVAAAAAAAMPAAAAAAAFNTALAAGALALPPPPPVIFPAPPPPPALQQQQARQPGAGVTSRDPVNKHAPADDGE